MSDSKEEVGKIIGDSLEICIDASDLGSFIEKNN
jgi:hypothetical protein